MKKVKVTTFTFFIFFKDDILDDILVSATRSGGSNNTETNRSDQDFKLCRGTDKDKVNSVIGI